MILRAGFALRTVLRLAGLALRVVRFLVLAQRVLVDLRVAGLRVRLVEAAGFTLPALLPFHTEGLAFLMLRSTAL